MNTLFLVDRIKNKLQKWYRQKVFYQKTRQRVNLIGDITLINTNIQFGKNVTIYPNVMLFGDGRIEIGDNVSIGNGTILYASKSGGGITIGNDTQIAAQCYIIDMNHGTESGELIRKQPNTVAPISIGQDVWIAAGCKVLKGSVIHNGAVIGANSVVNSEIEENAIAVGCPARMKKRRGDK